MGLFGSKNERTNMLFKHITGLNSSSGATVSLNRLSENLAIKQGTDGNLLCEIDYCDIISINDYNEQETTVKNKSVIGRAVVGGALTGGLGAIVGGMSGVGSKTKKGKLKFYIDIDYIKNGTKLSITLEDSQPFVSGSFIGALRSRIVEAKQRSHQPISENKLDIPDQIRKLADLREQGILTEEEFLQGKAKILNS